MKNDMSASERAFLAKKLRSLRRVERKVMQILPHWRDKRDRAAKRYLLYLRGLEGSLDYVRGLPAPMVIDLGAGTSRAISEIARSRYGVGLEFFATGLIRDPEIAMHLGQGRYRITSAEVMRGFAPNSVGGFTSVFGPFEYSSRRDLVMRKVDELLVPRGILKFCVMKSVGTASPEMQERHLATCKAAEDTLLSAGYAFAVEDYAIEDRNGASRIFLATKPDDGMQAAKMRAERLLEQDFASKNEMAGNIKTDTSA